jgi:pantetheine-phosphate adenylyltransferase
MSTVIYPGSFNPWTIGHHDILKRTLQMFDKVLVVIATNPDKLVNKDKIKWVLAPLEQHFNGHVEVTTHEGLISDFKLPIIRGVRSGDWEYEQNIAMWNKELGVETIFMCPNPAIAHINSSALRLLHNNGVDITPFVGLPDIAKRWKVS